MSQKTYPVSSQHLSGPTPSSLTDGPFTLSAPCGSDTWRTPPATDRFTSPVAYTPIRLGSLRRMRVTATAHWQELYDQAGLTIILPPPGEGDGDAGAAAAADAETDRRPIWLKAGLEVVDGIRHASVVRAEPYSDWSMTPLEGVAGHEATTGRPRGSITVEFERDLRDPAEGGDGKELAKALWIYVVRADGSRQRLRECTAMFDRPDDTPAWVGVYLARPVGPQSREPLEVEFSDFQLETA